MNFSFNVIVLVLEILVSTFEQEYFWCIFSWLTREVFFQQQNQQSKPFFKCFIFSVDCKMLLVLYCSRKSTLPDFAFCLWEGVSFRLIVWNTSTEACRRDCPVIFFCKPEYSSSRALTSQSHFLAHVTSFSREDK